MKKHCDNCTCLAVDDRELATILAALRFHQAENLQGSGGIPDQAICGIATDMGRLAPLDFYEVDDLCEKLNCCESQGRTELTIEPPPKDSGDEPLYRVVYAIDLSAADPAKAAEEAHRIIADPGSLPPVLDVMDHSGKVTRIDLSDQEHINQTDREGKNL